jgi:hypothetical protein
MKLYVANCTKQPHDFQYWEQEGRRPFSRNISAGSQIAIDLGTRDAVDHVIGQHEQYGLTHVRELKEGKPFSGLAYSIDAPMNVDEITAGLGFRDDTMMDAATVSRQNQAAVNDNVLNEVAQQSGAKLLHSEFEVVEQQTSQSDSSDKLEQKIVVERPGRAKRERRAAA